MSTVPYLLMETPNTPSGHRFLVPAGVSIDSAHAAAVCAKMTREGTFQGDAWLGVVQRQVQESLDAGRVGLAKTALVGVHVARLSPSQREEIFDQLTTALAELPGIVESIDWEQSGARLVVASELVSHVVLPEWHSLPRMSSGTRPARRRFVPIAIVLVALVVLGGFAIKSKLPIGDFAGKLKESRVEPRSSPVATEYFHATADVQAPKASAEITPPTIARSATKISPPPPTAPVMIDLVEILAAESSATVQLDRVAEAVGNNVLGSVRPADNLALAEAIWTDALGESGEVAPGMAKMIHKRSSDLSDRRLTPAFQIVWERLGKRLVHQMNRQMATAIRESDSKGIDAAIARLPIHESLSRISADNERYDWKLLENEVKVQVERRRHEAREWIEKLSKQKVKIIFEVVETPEDRGAFARQITIESMVWVPSPETPQHSDEVQPLRWHDNIVSIPASLLAHPGRAQIKWTYREQSVLIGGKGRTYAVAVMVADLRTREKPIRKADFKIYLEAQAPHAPEWLNEVEAPLDKPQNRADDDE